jgi:regulator of replication initiation timing
MTSQDWIQFAEDTRRLSIEAERLRDRINKAAETINTACDELNDTYRVAQRAAHIASVYEEARNAK